MTDLLSSSREVGSRSNSTLNRESVDSQPATGNVASSIIDGIDRNILRDGALVSGVASTNRPLSTGFNNVDLSSIEHCRIHPFVNHQSAESNYFDSSAIVDHRNRPVVTNPSIPLHNNTLNLEHSVHSRSADIPSTFNVPFSTEALALMLQRVGRNTDTAICYSQALQSMSSPPVSAELSQLMTNHDALALSQRLLHNTQTEDILSRLQVDRNNQVQLRSLLNPIALSHALQAREENTQSPFDLLARWLSSVGAVQNFRDATRNQLFQDDALLNLLSRNNDPQQQSLREFMFGGHTAPPISDNNSNDHNNDDNFKNDGDDCLPQIVYQGDNNGNNTAEVAQQEDSIPSSRTNDLMTIANNVLEKYRSNS
jgi:hypothetical protein